MHLSDMFIIVHSKKISGTWQCYMQKKKIDPSSNKYKGFQVCSKLNYSNFDQIFRERY